LFAYPVLMTADILAVQSEIVPVGKDQKQHLEIARDLAIKFNGQYGEIFKIPEPMIQEEVAVVPGVDGQKMSKSYENTIEIFGSKKQIRKAIMRIVTDSKTLEEPKDPDTCNVFALYKLFASQEECEKLSERYHAGGMGYGDAKKKLFAKFEEHFAPMRERREELANNMDYVELVLQDGAARAKEVIMPTLAAARNAVGLE
jgi:tryptophanyl-tRNA synthetase